MAEELLLKNINKLPYELISIIKEYIPKTALVFLNKTSYFLYHKLIKKYIVNYESYIRHTIRFDNDFVFERIFYENYNIWIQQYNYIYKNIVFKNYLVFLIEYCVENRSSNCRMIIYIFLKEH